jgi:hypothetical protein
LVKIRRKQTQWLFDRAKSLRNQNPPQVEYAGNTATHEANAGLTFFNGKPINAGRSIFRHIHGAYNEEKRLHGEDSARIIAEAYVDRDNQYAYFR